MVPSGHSDAMLQETQAQMLFKIKYVFRAVARTGASLCIKLYIFSLYFRIAMRDFKHK